MTTLNLGEGRVVYRRPLAGDVRHFALSPKLGMIALADAGSGQVVLADPATLTPRLAYFVSGKPVDLVFADDGTTLVVAVAREDGGGELAVWKIKMDKKKGLQRKQERTVSLAGLPIRIAVSPDGRDVAVGLATAELQIVRVKSLEIVAVSTLPAAPRDVVWCDPSMEGPTLPDWSDDDEPQLNLGGS
jgi:DNA-binding beta-propeller fold protein YncE